VHFFKRTVATTRPWLDQHLWLKKVVISNYLDAACTKAHVQQGRQWEKPQPIQINCFWLEDRYAAVIKMQNVASFNSPTGFVAHSANSCLLRRAYIVSPVVPLLQCPGDHCWIPSLNGQLCTFEAFTRIVCVCACMHVCIMISTVHHGPKEIMCGRTEGAEPASCS